MKDKITNAQHKKKAIIAILIALCMVGGAAGGYVYMTHTDFGKADVASQSDDKELTAEEKEKAAEKDLEKAKESGDKEAVKEAEKEVEKAKEKVNASNSNSSSNSSSHKSNSGTSNKGSYSKPSNSGGSSNNKPSKPSSGNSGSSGSSSGGSSTSKPSKPAHTHSWKPVYGERTVIKYKEEGYSVLICNVCGAENPSNAHKENHVINGEGYGSHREIRYKQVPYEVTEKYIKYYKCSCGATK